VSDQNFKGTLLERALANGEAPLPSLRLRSSGTSKQIDASWALGDTLLIAEAKAVSRSIAFDRGDTQAIRYRNTQVVERGLSEVDDKCIWLREHPAGSNYDVSHFKRIVGLVVSPFVEFIPSRDQRYWLDSDTPRVLSLGEVTSFLKEPMLLERVTQFWNSHRIAKE
jgi:hypothetical protein